MSARRGKVLRLLKPARIAPQLAEALAAVRTIHTRGHRSDEDADWWHHLLFVLRNLLEFGSHDDDPDPGAEVPERAIAEPTEATG